MPRHQRTLSPTNTYHIMVRGINKQAIFLDERDRSQFLKTLLNVYNECDFDLYAFCLMSNHFHIVLKTNGTPLDVIVKKFNTSYVYYFNQRYGRVGHLFQDRFKSEPILTDAQLVQTIRYVHRNPVKANIVQDPESYKYSSYNSYLSENAVSKREYSFIASLFGSISQYISFHKEPADFKCMDLDESSGITTPDDMTAERILQDVTHSRDKNFLQTLSKKERDRYIIELRKRKLSIGQLSRLTGLSPGVIRGAK